MILKVFLIISIVHFSCTATYSQSDKDSVQLLLSKASNDSVRNEYRLKIISISSDSIEVNGFVHLIHKSLIHFDESYSTKMYFDITYSFYRKGWYEHALNEVNNLIKFCHEIGDKNQEGEGYRLKAKIEKKMLKYDKAITSNQQALSLFEKTNNYKKQTVVYNSIGIIHKMIGNYPEAIQNYHIAYFLSKENKLDFKTAITAVNLGVILKKQEKYEEALRYYLEAEDIYKKKQEYGGLADVYNNIGNIYRLQNKYHEALSYYHLAISNRIEAGEKERLAYTYNNISLVYTELEKYKEAIGFLLKSERIKLKYDDSISLGSTYLNLSEIYLKIDDDLNYRLYADKAFDIALKYKLNDTRRSIAVNNSSYEAKRNNFKEAYIKLLGVYNELDTLDNESQRILTSVLQAQFENKKDEIQIQSLSGAILLLDKQKNELEKENEISFKLIIGLGISLMILIALLFLLYKKQNDLKERTEELAESNKRLKESTMSIEEKELLLKEIHHRVKNNLQIIKSLIRLQKSENNALEENNILTDFELRVSSMALVHEYLYKSGNLVTIDLKEYFNNLIENLISVYQLNDEIEVEKKIEIDYLDIDTLVPLGLLSTEIISNSMKYGVSSLKNGKITVFLTPLDSEWYELLIRDNGNGFDFEKEVAKNTLGLELIATLVEQLDGELSFSNQSGAQFRIKFKAQVKKIIV